MLRPSEEQRMRRSKVCFVGYGSTEYSRNSEASALSYYADATRDALKRTGIDKKEIRGFSITTQASPDYSPHVAEQLGLEVDWVLNGDYGGAGGRNTPAWPWDPSARIGRRRHGIQPRARPARPCLFDRRQNIGARAHRHIGDGARRAVRPKELRFLLRRRAAPRPEITRCRSV